MNRLKYETAEQCIKEHRTDTGKPAYPNEVVLLYAGEVARAFIKGEISEQNLYQSLNEHRKELLRADGGNAAVGLIDGWGEYWG